MIARTSRKIQAMTTDQHPVHALAWDTSAAETQAMADTFDALAGTDAVQRQKLLNLIKWAAEQRSLDDAYNNTDFSGN